MIVIVCRKYLHKKLIKTASPHYYAIFIGQIHLPLKIHTKCYKYDGFMKMSV